MDSTHSSSVYKSQVKIGIPLSKSVEPIDQKKQPKQKKFMKINSIFMALVASI